MAKTVGIRDFPKFFIWGKRKIRNTLEIIYVKKEGI